MVAGRTRLDRRVVALLLLGARLLPRSRRGRGPRQRGSARAAPARERRASGWGDRFASELRRIAANQGRGLPPPVIEQPGLANVGTSRGRVRVDPAWMEQVSRSICDDRSDCRDALVHGIAAHEWSHATGSPSGAGSSHARELAADRDAGRALGRNGSSPRPFVALLEAGSRRGSTSHPPSTARVAATLAGHWEGQSQACDADRCSCGAPPDASSCELTRMLPAPRGSRAAAGRGTP